MPGLDQDLAFLKHDPPLLLVEAHIQRTVGIEVDHRAVGQAQGALLAGGGALVCQPVVHRQVAFPGKQRQGAEQHDAGDPATQLAYPPAQAFARLQQGVAGRAGGHAKALVEHAQLAPGAGVFFMGSVPLGKLFALHGTGAAIQRQLPGDGGIQHLGRHRLGTHGGHSGSPYRAM